LPSADTTIQSRLVCPEWFFCRGPQNVDKKTFTSFDAQTKL
jgi:hypothetical protein